MMKTPYARAILLGLLGPLIQVVGLLWALAAAALTTNVEYSFRYILFSPPHLVIAVGVLVTVISIPLAIEVAQAREEELEMEVFEPVPASEAQEEYGAGRARVPGHWETAE